MSDKTFVVVLDITGKELSPCSGKRARLLLDKKKAKVIKVDPFIIQMVKEICETKT